MTRPDVQEDHHNTNKKLVLVEGGEVSEGTEGTEGLEHLYDSEKLLNHNKAGFSAVSH
jgi:ribosomal protein S24E